MQPWAKPGSAMPRECGKHRPTDHWPGRFNHRVHVVGHPGIRDRRLRRSPAGPLAGPTDSRVDHRTAGPRVNDVPEPVLELIAVGRRTGGTTLLSGIDWRIDPGQHWVVMGPNGSGKTTLLNLIGGLDRPTTGKVFFKVASLESMSREQLAAYRRENIGFIFQTYNLLPVYSVYENILFPLLLNGLKESHVRERVENMVAKVGLMDQINKKPAQLSGGQCQRVAIARALVKDPMLILADEPTANLDSENSHQILELMRELNHEYKAAVIFSTHDEKVTRYIRREVRLEDGRVSWDKRRNGTEIET